MGRRGALSDSTLLVPTGSQFALLSSCDDELCASTTWVRFCNDSRILIGHRKAGTIEEQYGMQGFQPVVVNGFPLLYVANPREARLTLRLRAGETPTLQLIGLVSPYRGRLKTTCHIMESVAGVIVGGLTVQIGR
ncbi:hypothetical protein THII_3747 [Thioploca ingrica]|uniref:Uncharacterized protein n=1 Tax=Thioploca ingrica TaxID=40754 RepID=A0A090AKF7_9GAMM|nr:hypothetical protein THII_3747 [Thioploca ingrica]